MKVLRRMLNLVDLVFFLVSGILGNPIYQFLAFLICSGLGLATKKGGGRTVEVDLVWFVIILILIYGVRLILYVKKLSKKGIAFSYKGKESFFYVFAERHLYLFIGFLTFPIWLWEAEANIIGLIYLPVTLLVGVPLTVVTYNRLLKLESILGTSNAN